MLYFCFLTIRNLSNLPQSPVNGISETLNLKISLISHAHAAFDLIFSPPPPPNKKSFLRRCINRTGFKSIYDMLHLLHGLEIADRYTLHAVYEQMQLEWNPS